MSKVFNNRPIYSYKNRNNRETLVGIRHVYDDTKGLYVNIKNKKVYVKRNPKTNFISFYII